ncbi:uncharacterized protein PRCAT00001737001 [Priceomyces carsonii]|uniref:uncharacterized protein n=1 Tax=Priceomyces carsonii TaxID=28549 RepID=UPI002ED797C8|nr:unnamed protein product [Priceomyces carsonii]
MYTTRIRSQSVKKLIYASRTISLKHILSRSADEGLQSSAFPQISREKRNNVLNISPFQISDSISGYVSIPNLSTFYLVNLVLRSIIDNDYNKTIILLGKLETNFKKNMSEDVLKAYFSSLIIFLAHNILQHRSSSIHDMRLIVDGFVGSEKIAIKQNLHTHLNIDVEEVKAKIITNLILSFQGISSKEILLQKSVASYIMSTSRLLNLNYEEYKKLESNREILKCFRDIAGLQYEDTGIAIDQVKKTPKEFEFGECRYEPYTNDLGLTSLSKLCKFISETRFTKFDRGHDNRPLYVIYDGLSSEEKTQFFKDYLEFNVQRESNIEAHCLDLVEDTTLSASAMKNKTLKMSKFHYSNSQLVYMWYTANLNHLTSLQKRFNLSSEQMKLDPSDDEYYLRKFSSFLSLIPEKILVTMIISTLLTKTLSSEKGYSTVLDISSALASSFKRLALKEMKFQYVERIFNDFFANDVGIQMFSALLKVFIENCRIPKSMINQEALKNAHELNALMGDNFESLFINENNESYPAFCWGYSKELQKRTFKNSGIIKIHPYLIEEFEGSKILPNRKSLYLPMLVAPKVWTTPNSGGYLQNVRPLVNSIDNSLLIPYFSKANQTGQLSSVFEGLNILGSNGWAVNSPILEIFNKVMTFDKGFLKIPPKIDFMLKNLTKELRLCLGDNLNKIESRKRKNNLRQEYHDSKSQRMEHDLFQTIVNSYGKNGDIFFLPHNVDFRGRAYPMVSTLSYYQGDLARGLLMFWKGKPLGESGLKWLKYQLAGTFGISQTLESERLCFVESNMDAILDSAENPLDGKMWWSKAEKPWQTLALCIELRRISDYVTSGLPIEEYICRIPVHQDGSCNGLQHYAALGNDQEGGLAVNLLSDQSNKKRDVYSKVLEIVTTKVVEDFDDENSFDNLLANMALPLLSRKLIKRTVMTSVYGVTNYGAAAQIEEKITELIREVDFHLRVGDPSLLSNEQLNNLKDNKRRVSAYLSGIVIRSISELFSGARQIQEWLETNCFRILNSFDINSLNFIKKTFKRDQDFFQPLLFNPMMWTTISGFPVIQPYKNTKLIILPTALQHILIRKPNKIATIDLQKQIQAVSPNFIHSLDAIHMFMTCLAASRKSIAFASVHDSFWTHPSDVDELSKIIREEFVRLYESNIIELLRDDFNFTVRNSYQLLWINNSTNKEFVDKLLHFRENFHNIKAPFTKLKYNKILNVELEVQSLKAHNQIIDLVQRYNPTLYFRSRRSANFLEPYTSEIDTKKTDGAVKFSIKKFTPILFPVNILKSPPTGELDIKGVLESKYFFS